MLLSPLSEGSKAVRMETPRRLEPHVELSKASFRISGLAAGKTTTTILPSTVHDLEQLVRQLFPAFERYMMPALKETESPRQLAKIWCQGLGYLWPYVMNVPFTDSLNQVGFFYEAKCAYLGLARTNIKDGDLLLTFERCDVKAIFRPNGDGYKFISQAIAIGLMGDQGPFSDERFTTGFEIDANTLQSLTCPL